MGATHRNFSTLHQLEVYIFPSALAVNFFLAVVIIANSLSIRYFLYAAPMVIQINLLPSVWATLFWIASLYALYVTKEILAENPSFRFIKHSLDVALIGSFFLIASVILSSIRFSFQPSARLLFDQLSPWVSSFGFILSFVGAFLALLITLSHARRPAKLFLVYLFSLIIPIEILSLMHWVAYPFDVIGNLGFAWQGAFLELQLFYLVYPLIFWLFIALLFSWIWMPILRYAKEKFRTQSLIRPNAFSPEASNSNTIFNKPSVWEPQDYGDQASLKPSINRFLPVGVLLVSLALGIFIAYYPYLSREPGLVGVDSLGYYYTLTALDGKSLFEAAQLANEINSARVLYHMMLYAFRNLSQLPASTVIELMPVPTILANALAVFWFVKTTERNELLASMAAVFSVFSFTTTVSMHAATLANWFAVALGFVMFGLVLELLEKPAPKLFLALTVALISLFLVHYWTGLFFIVVLALYLALTSWERRQFSVKLAFAGVILALGVLIIVFSSGLLPRLLIPYGISNVFADSVSPQEMIVSFWTRLPVLINLWFLGALANPVMIGLGLIGAVVCFYHKTRLSRLLISWTVAGSLLSVLVSPIGADMNQWLMWRMLYLIPFQVQAALGLFFISSKLAGLWQNESDFKLPSKGLFNLESQNGYARNQNLLIVLYLATDFVISAVLSLSLPILFSLVVLNYLVLTLIIHLKIRTARHNQILVLMFNLLIVLVLLNYTLRSLVPLTLIRFIP